MQHRSKLARKMALQWTQANAYSPIELMIYTLSQLMLIYRFFAVNHLTDERISYTSFDVVKTFIGHSMLYINRNSKLNLMDTSI